MIEIKNLPLSVPISAKKKFILNLNNYRNAHFQVLAKAKKNYSAIVSEKVKGLVLPECISIEYTYYHGRRGRVDVANPCSIIDKFFSDALVENGCIADDDMEHVKEVTYRWGGYDKENPRVDILIKRT